MASIYELIPTGPIVPHPALRPAPSRMDSIVVTQSNNMNAPPAPSPAPPRRRSPVEPQQDREFHFFPRLPPEIRAQVWEYATFPRVVCVAYNPKTARVESDTPIPTLLHVNQESRYEALRRYKKLFASKSNPDCYTLYRPHFDTLYFPRHREMGYDDTLRDFATYMKKAEDLACITRLALDSVDNAVKRPWEAYDKAVLIKSFPNLAALFLVRKRKEKFLSNMPRDFLSEKMKAREIKFVPYEDEDEAARVGQEFEMQFNREETMLKDIWASEGMKYEAHQLPDRKSVV